MGGDDSEKGNRFDREWRRNKEAGEAVRALADDFYKAYADQPKFELPPFQSADEAQYKLCLPPRKALRRYELTPPLAMLQLNRELLADLVHAVALKAIWNDTDEHGTLQFAIVPYWVWRSAHLKEDSDFWDTGFLEVHFPGEDYNYRRWAQLFGVRFWPAGLPQLEPTTTDPGSSNADETKKGGRPAGKHGEPIARLTMRLVNMTAAERDAYTAASLGRDLIAEFKALGLAPPSLDNAERDAAGILRAVRN